MGPLASEQQAPPSPPSLSLKTQGAAVWSAPALQPGPLCSHSCFHAGGLPDFSPASLETSGSFPRSPGGWPHLTEKGCTYALDVLGLGQGGSGPPGNPSIFPVPVLLCEEAHRGEACPLGCLCVSGSACEWPSLVWSPQHLGGKSGQLSPAVCRFAECGVCRPQSPFGWSLCCSDPPERWPEECALLGPRIS